MCETRLKWELSRDRFERNLSLISLKYERISSSMRHDQDVEQFHPVMEVGPSIDEASYDKFERFFDSFFDKVGGDCTLFGQNRHLLSVFPDDGDDMLSVDFESDTDEPLDEADGESPDGTIAAASKLDYCQASCELTQSSCCLSACGKSFVECISMTANNGSCAGEHDSTTTVAGPLCLTKTCFSLPATPPPSPPFYEAVEIFLPDFGNVMLPLPSPKTISVKFKIPKGIIELLTYPTVEDVLSRFFYYERRGTAPQIECGEEKLTDRLKPLVEKHLTDMRFAFLLENTSLLAYQRLHAVDSKAAEFVDFHIELDQQQQKALVALKFNSSSVEFNESSRCSSGRSTDT